MKPELFNSLKGYKRQYLINDILAGLMVAIIAMPLSIALGIQSVPESVSSNGINYGICTAIIAGFLISLFGGSRFQIGGPTAAFVVILFGYIANEQIGLLGLAFAGVFAGIILILMGVFKLGKVMKIFPYSISIGFTTGIGITLIVGQLKDFFGLTNCEGADFISKISSYIKNISSFNLGTFIVAVVGLAIVIVLPKVNKKIPSAFVALIVCTLLTLFVNGVCGGNVATIGNRYGDIKASFILPEFSSISTIKWSALIVPSFVIALLCAIESLLSATVASGMTGTTYNANQELIGQGVANICSSLLGGLPATGAIARTAASIENKAKSPLAGIFHAVFLLIMYFALMGVLKYVPLAVFASILISVAINMSKFPYFIKLVKFSVKDTIVLLLTCLLTVFLDLTYGVLGAFALSLILNIPNIKNKIDVEINGNQIVLRGSLYFLNSEKLVVLIKAKFTEYDKLIIDCRNLKEIDITVFEKLIKVKRSFEKQNKSLEFENLTVKLQETFDRFALVI